jgi:hypothetical protein
VGKERIRRLKYPKFEDIVLPKYLQSYQMKGDERRKRKKETVA